MLRFFHRSTGHTTFVSYWSPFARNEGRDCECVAQALLTALDYEGCCLDELTPTRYAELRRKRPQMGLPRTTTVTGVCGSWDQAIEAAHRHAAALARAA